MPGQSRDEAAARDYHPAVTAVAGFLVVLGASYTMIELVRFIEPLWLFHFPFIAKTLGVVSACLCAIFVNAWRKKEPTNTFSVKVRTWMHEHGRPPVYIFGALFLTLFFLAAGLGADGRITREQLAQEELRAQGMDVSLRSLQNAIFFNNARAMNLFRTAGVNVNQLYLALSRSSDFSGDAPLLQAIFEQNEIQTESENGPFANFAIRDGGPGGRGAGDGTINLVNLLVTTEGSDDSAGRSGRRRAELDRKFELTCTTGEKTSARSMLSHAYEHGAAVTIARYLDAGATPLYGELHSLAARMRPADGCPDDGMDIGDAGPRAMKPHHFAMLDPYLPLVMSESAREPRRGRWGPREQSRVVDALSRRKLRPLRQTCGLLRAAGLLDADASNSGAGVVGCAERAPETRDDATTSPTTAVAVFLEPSEGTMSRCRVVDLLLEEARGPDDSVFTESRVFGETDGWVSVIRYEIARHGNDRVDDVLVLAPDLSKTDGQATRVLAATRAHGAPVASSYASRAARVRLLDSAMLESSDPTAVDVSDIALNRSGALVATTTVLDTSGAAAGRLPQAEFQDRKVSTSPAVDKSARRAEAASGQSEASRGKQVHDVSLAFGRHARRRIRIAASRVAGTEIRLDASGSDFCVEIVREDRRADPASAERADGYWLPAGGRHTIEDVLLPRASLDIRATAIPVERAGDAPTVTSKLALAVARTPAKLLCEPASAATLSPIPLQAHESARHVVPAGGDGLRCPFTVENAIDSTFTVDAGEVDVDIELHGPGPDGGATVLAQSFNEKGEEEIEAELEQGASYELRLLNLEEADSPARLSVALHEREPRARIDDAFGNSREAATRMALGAFPVEGGVGWGDASSDWFLIELTRPRMLRFELTDLEVDIDIAIYAAESESPLAEGTEPETTQERLSSSLQPGRYHIHVFRVDAGQGLSHVYKPSTSWTYRLQVVPEDES